MSSAIGSGRMRALFAIPGAGGGQYQLRDDVPVPTPGPHQVLVEVKASSLNRGEANALARLTHPPARPGPAGLEFSGIVVGLGEGATRWKAGDHVMARAAGGFASFAVGHERALLAKPAGLSWAEAATIPNVFVTAHDAIVTAGGLRQGETVLVTAGSSGVGVAALKLARHLGAGTVIASSRGAGKVEALHGLGADHVIDTEQADWPKRLLQLTADRGVDLIVDLVGSTLLEGNIRALAVGGRLITVGRNAGSKAICDLDEIARKNARIIGTSFRTRTPEQTYECIERFGADSLAAFHSGQIKPVLDRSYPLAAIADALAYLRSNAQVGKIAIEIAD